MKATFFLAAVSTLSVTAVYAAPGFGTMNNNFGMGSIMKRADTTSTDTATAKASCGGQPIKCNKYCEELVDEETGAKYTVAKCDAICRELVSLDDGKKEEKKDEKKDDKAATTSTTTSAAAAATTTSK